MSKKPSQQQRAAAREARANRHFWEKARETDGRAGKLTDESARTYDRAIARNRAIENKGKSK